MAEGSVLSGTETTTGLAPEPSNGITDSNPAVAVLSEKKDLSIISAQPVLEKRARGSVKEKIRIVFTEGNRFSPLVWLKRAGLRTSEEYWLQRDTHETMDVMARNNNTLLSLPDIKKAAASVTKRVSVSNSDERLQLESGVQRAKIIKTEGLKLAGSDVRTASDTTRQLLIQEVIQPVLNKRGLMGADVETNLREALTTFVKNHQDIQDIADLFGSKTSSFGRTAEYFASDLQPFIEQLRTDRAAHDFALAELDQMIGNITVGNIDWAADSAAHFSKVDTWVAWAQGGRIRGKILNPAAMGALASIGIFGAQNLARRAGKFAIPAAVAGVIASPIIAPITGLLVGALFAGERRNRDLKNDRAMHEVERAYNKQIPPKSPRREALEKFRYNTASVDDLINGNGNELLGGGARQSIDTLTKLDLSDGQDTNRQSLVRRIAEIQSRLDTSVIQKIDLISSSTEKKFEIERGKLVEQMVVGIQALKAAGMNRTDIDHLVNIEVGKWNQLFIQNQEQQDKAFKTYRLGFSPKVNLRNRQPGQKWIEGVGQVYTAGAIGGITGLVSGLLVQEGLALGGRHIGGLENAPVIGGLFKTGQTAIESLAGIKDTTVVSASIEGFKSLFKSGGQIDTGKYIITTNTVDHSIGFVDKATNQILPTNNPIFIQENGNIVSSGEMNNLPAPAQELLKGMPVAETTAHSLRQQIIDASTSGQPELIKAGNTELNIQGNQLNITDQAGNHIIGTLDQGNINLSGSEGAVTAIRSELADQGFETQNLVENTVSGPSSMDQMKGFVQAGQGTLVEGDLQTTVDGNNVSIHSTSTGETFNAVANQDGNLQFSGSRDELQHIQSLLAAQNWQAPEIVDNTTQGPTLTDRVHEIITSGRHENITQGNLRLDINGAEDQVSITDTSSGEHFSAFIDPNTDQITINTADSNIDLSKVHTILQAAGFTGIKESTNTQQVDALQEFRVKGLVEHANRLLWHDNDTPMHLNDRGILVGADGKELQFYHHALQDGSVDLDMSKMISQMTAQGGVNWDNTVDSQYSHVMKDIVTNPDGSHSYKNFEFLFTTNDAADKAREVIRLSIGSDGHLKLPHGADLRQFFQTDASGKLVLDQNGQPIQIGRFIEVAHVEHDAAGNVTGRTILSTSVGKSLDNITVTKHDLVATLPSLTNPQPNFTLPATPSSTPVATHTFSSYVIPPAAHEWTPFPVDNTPPPFIPIPVAPRFPLEPMGEPPIPPDPEDPEKGETGKRKALYYYLGEPSPEVRAYYAARRSPRLNQNPNVILDPRTEEQWYLEQQPADYRQDLESLNSTINDSMEDACRAAICIAAASHQEGPNIYHTLMQYTGQVDYAGNPLNPNVFEIVLFLNRPESSTADQTSSEVERFKQDHPEIKVRVIEKLFPVRPAMGIISKYVDDIALLRSSKRTLPTNPDLILVNNDADADLISKNYISTVIQEFDDPNKNVEAALGKIEWTTDSYLKYPGFHVANRFYQFIEAQKRHIKNAREVGSSGANFTLRSSIYAAVGGFAITDDVGQDVQLGRMIRAARPRSSGVIDYMGSAWIETSPRRGLKTYRSGVPVVFQWDDWEENQTEVRIEDWRTNNVISETIDTISPDSIASNINATLSVYDVPADSRMAERALGFIGLNSQQYCQNRVDNLERSGKNGTSPEMQNLLASLGLRTTDYHLDNDKIIVDSGHYHLENGKVIIDNITHVQENLRNYQNTERNKSNERKNQALTGNLPSRPTAPTPEPAPIVSSVPTPPAIPTPVVEDESPTFEPVIIDSVPTVAATPVVEPEPPAPVEPTNIAPEVVEPTPIAVDTTPQVTPEPVATVLPAENLIEGINQELQVTAPTE